LAVRNGLLDGIEEGDERLRAVPAVALADHTPRGARSSAPNKDVVP
jgi:hypothetical protein